ncbi:hypothetical protein Afil01_29120 [Actinorhabdospora filicis]|uniref:FHA domain-containing protein n=1 Tax=Actinorhabdospora filicis TaxID=1785913 RepID=A0A9W6SLH5_9ACTN|nr:FHA domain-containing protein [Actinorhabdospora filicis]GLZ78105.1 hypothetical protein Afil01_29120 [Actinorhabdospora filicis]
MDAKPFAPRVLPASTPGLATGAPLAAPPGTIFVMSARGGYAVPPRPFTLHFGRGDGDVHIVIGADDPYVSRQHGVLICDGRDWWIQNKGRLPIQVPNGPLLLSGHDTLIAPGYTPMTINSVRNRSHVLEVRVNAFDPAVRAVRPTSKTKPLDVHELSRTEHLVLTVLAQRYLLAERYPQPLSWKQAALTLGQVPGQREWTPKAVEHVVSAVRKRLAAGEAPVPGILRDREMAEPVGNTLNHNLIMALLKSSTLMPEDLGLLGEPR